MPAVEQSPNQFYNNFAPMTSGHNFQANPILNQSIISNNLENNKVPQITNALLNNQPWQPSEQKIGNSGSTGQISPNDSANGSANTTLSLANTSPDAGSITPHLPNMLIN